MNVFTEIAIFDKNDDFEQFGYYDKIFTQLIKYYLSNSHVIGNTVFDKLYLFI